VKRIRYARYISLQSRRHITNFCQNRVLILGLTFAEKFTECSELARAHARERFEPEASNIIRAKAEEEEKKRKKEQQKTRRREKTAMQNKLREEQRAKDKAEAAARKRKEDDERNAKLAEQKNRLDDESIHDTDNSAAVVVDEDGAKIKKRRVAPKKPKAKAPAPVKEEPVVPEKIEPHVSKGYNLMYEQIWKDIARRDVPKVYKIQQASLNIKQSNLRKTAQLAAKEARRWQQRTNKNVKDTQARAKRSMREMLTFWKRNEREERDNRRKAEKEAIERAKREEEMREQKRQARKLNFLISQTELYSHFVGRKIKTNELERSTDTATEGHTETAAEKVPDAVKAGVTGVAGPKKFDDLDFDNDDETHLHQAAMHNAQAALQETQERARAFNAGAADTSKTDIDMEDGEMNFQNPTGLGDIEITQPKLLSCQLKEYQIKGLNWLANLYEQGINGILADEMGLGKTVQSISVMAYLAEKYDIWGPYLVVAPASTLHNWAQEITKFVPEFKVLPYWGNQRDRQILRKFWDRKSPTYRKDAQFHVLITSYQIVVGDAQYFQKMRWQYMILDEAQAIKSSQSSRWKTLLAMQCRNRLLLTGTPIQNSMQGKHSARYSVLSVH
jgi:chromatin-remodeling ATPase INO80